MATCQYRVRIPISGAYTIDQGFIVLGVDRCSIRPSTGVYTTGRRMVPVRDAASCEFLDPNGRVGQIRRWPPPTKSS